MADERVVGEGVEVEHDAEVSDDADVDVERNVDVQTGGLSVVSDSGDDDSDEGQEG